MNPLRPPIVASGDVTDALDQSVLSGLRELGDQKLLAELAELFLEDATSHLEALREAVEDDDPPSVVRVAHTLKGTCGSMGALRMSATCAELEDVGHSGELERTPVLVERLGAEFGGVRMALEAEMDETEG